MKPAVPTSALSMDQWLQLCFSLGLRLPWLKLRARFSRSPGRLQSSIVPLAGIRSHRSHGTPSPRPREIRPMAHPMLLLAWLAVGLALAQGQTHQAFVRKHINYPRTPVTPYCDRMMQRRNMTMPVCKEINTFIIADTIDVINICGSGGTSVPGTNLWTSTQPFTLVDCRLKGATPKPPCSYQETPGHNRICIACEQGLPVHFEKIIL